MIIFRLPDLGEGLHEAEIVAWHVAPGEHVVADQPLVSVETEKAVVQIPAPRAGRVARLRAEPGELVRVGEPLVDLDDLGSDDGAVVGALPTGATPDVAGHGAPEGTGRATPAVRALARRLGVDLTGLVPSGPAGTLPRRDVEQAARERGGEAAEPLRGVRRAMADAMTRSGAEVVAATLTDEADVEAWAGGEDVTVRLVLAIAAACRAVPALNAWYEPHPPGRRVHPRLDLGVAIETEEGLFAPVLRDAGAADATGVRDGLERLRAAARERTLTRADVGGATFTLSNFGMLGGRYATLVVVPPQVAILGAGRIAPRAVAHGGRVAVRRTLPLSLTFDHRAVTGAEAARFLTAALGHLEGKR